eukprot:COSAG06_NODE_7739_length_2394_cov_2.354248_3_plen_78_part_00
MHAQANWAKSFDKDFPTYAWGVELRPIWELGKNVALFCPFLYTNDKTILLPRPARDKHRETTQQKAVFAGAHRQVEA